MATYDLTSSIPSPNSLAVGDIINCPYSGTYKTIILPQGTYILECWGAQGGSSGNSSWLSGGKGGYAKGTITLSTSFNLIWLYAGGQGSKVTATTQLDGGGFNGGGHAVTSSSSYMPCGGGGASDIRINYNSLFARVIVAGGGGGASAASREAKGGYGGGTSGQAGTAGSYYGGGAGTSTSVGTSYYTSQTTDYTYSTLGGFGFGASGSASAPETSGGGGGWYGGGSAYRGGGGSGYVYTSSSASQFPKKSSSDNSCLLQTSYYLSNTTLSNGSVSFYNPSGTSETGHSGNGYVRIRVSSLVDNFLGTKFYDLNNSIPSPTSLKKTDIIGCFCNQNSKTLILPPGVYKIQCWGAQGGTAGNISTSSYNLGGKGGYTEGLYSILQNTTLYLYPGGKGIDNSNIEIQNGGWNGGGNSGYCMGGSGGGATDIRIGGTDLSNRIIVAGGGGGGCRYSAYAGGYGGGTSGQRGTGYSTTYSATGGTSTAGGTAGGYSGYKGTDGSLGQGGNANTTNSTYSRSGGGGGGYYGGGGGGYRNSGSYYYYGVSGGGGGSSYISYSSFSSRVNSDGGTSFNSPAGYSETGHSGDGFIKITVQQRYIIKPTAKTFTYDGTTHSGGANILNNFDSSTMSISGSTSATNAGNYTVSVTPKTGYYWTDGTDTAISLTWSITKVSVAKPTGSGSFTYDGNSHTCSINGYNSSIMTESGTKTATNAGSYTVTYTLKDTTNYQWSDGTTTAVSINWSISKVSLIKPTGGKQLPYIGSAYTNISDLINGYDASTMSASGDTFGTNIDDYNIIISLQDTDNYQWSDGTTSTLSLIWSIIKNVVTKPHGSYQPDAYYDININYAGPSTSVWPYIEDYDSTIMDYSGQTSPMIVNNSALGGYEVEFSLKDTTNYEWSDGTTGYVKIKWAVIRGIVTSPTGGNSFVYNGTPYNTISSLINGYDSDLMSASGDTSGTNVGTYTITVALKDKYNYQWSSTNNYFDLSLNWYITPLLLTKPTGKIIYYTGFVYDNPNDYLNNFDSSIMNISGDISEIDEGTYTVLISLKDFTNYNWNDNSTSTLSLDWIIKKLLTKPTSSSKIYNGSSQSFILTDYDSSLMTASGDTSGTNVGTYTVSVSIQDLVHYEWSDNTNSAINVNWYISKANVTKPTGGSREYNGNSQTYIINGYDSNIMNISGDLLGVNKGQYYVTVSLQDTLNYQWSDGTITPINLIWEIKGSLLIYTKISNNTWKPVKAYMKIDASQHKKIVEGYIKTVNGWRSIIRDD